MILSKLKLIFDQFNSNDESQIKFGQYMKLIRFSLTNLKVGAPVAETIQLLGKNRTINYLKKALDYVEQSL